MAEGHELKEHRDLAFALLQRFTTFAVEARFIFIFSSCLPILPSALSPPVSRRVLWAVELSELRAAQPV